MTREAKIGLFMVAVLVGVFGFLVYQRIHRPAQILANEALRIRESDVSESDKDEDLQRFEDDPPQMPRQEKPSLTREIKMAAHNFEKFSEDVAEEVVEEAKSVVEDRPHHAHLDLPNDLETDEAEPARFVRSREEDERSLELPASIDDSSDNNLENIASTTDSPDKDLPDSQPASDPFANDSPESKSSPIDFENSHKRHPHSEPRADDSDIPAERERWKKEAAILETEDSDNEPAYTREPARRPEFSPREHRRAAPINDAEDAAGFTRASPKADMIEGKTYTIQPHDNFWTISRRRYGAGRYYMALALHNQQTIPDPKKMKPGVVIATPEVSVLERHYSDSIPKAAADESSNSVRSSQSTQLQESGTAGFFIADHGERMYRVGPKDTLTEIAKAHLRRASRWVQILEMNRNVVRDANDLKVGTVLRLPADASSVRMAGAFDNDR